jgi:hypothetical protein
MIVTKPIILNRTVLEKLMNTPEFLYIQYSQDIDMTGLTIAFSYNGAKTIKKTNNIDFEFVEQEEETELENI